ncbi:hypothetical protein CCL11_25255 [Pseudomonas syringae]|nr:hypothetical protein CCL11_25255 [Pseudomonas syringae]PBP68784.1 hypothetical protein CCL21_14190 [Pseudomonas syringae]PYD15638.1 hypothetical protein DND47_14200 [Pseudomonas syringae pv. syringae]RXT62851.1 hypothetical protein B1F74_16220 [Pseudomonas syringae]
MKSAVTQPRHLDPPVLNLSRHARVQCCAFFCETVLFNAPGHPPRTLQFCCATSATGSIPSQNTIDQVAIE